MSDDVRPDVGLGGPSFDAIGAGPLVFSPDGTRLAYAARRGADWFVVEGERLLGPYSALVQNMLAFSPDSRRLVFAAAMGGGWRIVVDGERGPAYSSILPGPPGLVFDQARRLVRFIAVARNQVVKVEQPLP